MQAAIGLAQMERLDYFLTLRDEIVARYDAALSQVPGIILPPRAPWARNIHWLYSILVEPSEAGIDRDALATRLALSELYLKDMPGFLLLDDPFTDMDTTRRTAAIQAIGTLAENHQVLFFTCHPDHAGELQSLAAAKHFQMTT